MPLCAIGILVLAAATQVQSASVKYPGTYLTPKPKPPGGAWHGSYLYQNMLVNGSYDKRAYPTNQTVVMNFQIEEVSEISTKEGKVRVVGGVRLWWVDDRLRYPSSALQPGVPGLLVQKNDIWWPDDITMVNTMEIRNHEATTSVVRVLPDGSCYTSTVKEYSILCPMNVKDFPFDVQTCVINTESWLRPAGVVRLVGTGRSNGGLIKAHPAPKKPVSNLEFDLSDGGFETFYYCNTYGAQNLCYSSVNFYLRLTRHPDYYVSMLVVPVALLGYLAWCGMFIDKKAAPARVGLNLTICLTQAALQIPVAQFVPVNRDGTWIGTFQTTAFTFAAWAALEYTIVNYFVSRKRMKLETGLLPLAWLLRMFHMAFRVPEVSTDPDANAAGMAAPSDPTLEEQIKPAVQQVFSRYDLDGSGFIDTAEEFDQLTTYLLFTSGHIAPMNHQAVAEKMKHMHALKPESLRAMKIDVDIYTKWFADAAGVGIPKAAHPAQQSGTELELGPSATGIDHVGSGSTLYSWPPSSRDFADWVETFTRTAYFVAWTGYLTASWSSRPNQ